MAAQEAAAGSLSLESCVLELPSTYDISRFVLQRPSQEPSSEALGPVEFQSFPCSSDVDPDTCNLNTEPKDSWASENYSIDASVEGQSGTEEEDEGLRKSLDVFYEAFGRPQLASRNPLSVRVCQCLTQKITELRRSQESQAYTLRTFQMARVILSRDGCSVLQRHSEDTCFYPLEETGASLDDEKPVPGLSADVIRFLLQQKVMKEP